MDGLVTISDAARRCSVHESTIRRRIAAGKLRSFREGGQLHVLETELVAGGSHFREGQRETFPRAKDGVLRDDDPFLQLVGTLHDEASGWVSGDKYRALSEAYSHQL